MCSIYKISWNIHSTTNYLWKKTHRYALSTCFTKCLCSNLDFNSITKYYNIPLINPNSAVWHYGYLASCYSNTILCGVWITGSKISVIRFFNRSIIIILLLKKRVLKVINNANYCLHTDPLFLKDKLLKVKDLYISNLGIFLFQLSRQELSSAIIELF